MNNQKPLGLNAVLNAIKSSLSILFPLIIYPYVFHVLHSENIGKVNFASSIVSYFSMFAMLGVTQYAVREGAKIRNNKDEINKLTSEIFTINVISTIVSYVLLAVCIISISKLHLYSELILICSISIAFNTLGIEWVNTIYEDYLYITIRSIIINIISLVFIFIFVKSEDDLYIYAFLSILGSVITGIVNWRYCRRYIRLKLTKSINFKRHFKPISILFANALATNIYVNSDITMIGWFCGDYNVGIYVLAVKVYSVIKNIMAALYAVTVPRISYYFGAGDNEKVMELYSNLISSILLILLPASAGIISVAPEIIMFIGGNEYIESIVPLRILGISLIGAIFAGLLTYCLNIPLGREMINFQATIISALLNIGLNFVLIELLSQNGAAITTAISEFSVFFYCLFRSRNEIKLYVDIKRVIHYLLQSVAGVIVVITVTICTHHILGVSFVSFTIIVMSSVIVYGVLLILVKNSFVLALLKWNK